MQRVLKHSTVLPENIFFFFCHSSKCSSTDSKHVIKSNQLQEMLFLYWRASKIILTLPWSFKRCFIYSGYIFFLILESLCLAILLRVINTRTHLYSLSPFFSVCQTDETETADPWWICEITGAGAAICAQPDVMGTALLSVPPKHCSKTCNSY